MIESLRSLLRQELEVKKSKNPKYSLRALSRDIGISPSVVSDYLNGKRKLLPKTKYKLILYLKLPKDRMQFLKD